MMASKLRQMSLLHSTSYCGAPASSGPKPDFTPNKDATFRSLTVGKPQAGVGPTAEAHR